MPNLNVDLKLIAPWIVSKVPGFILGQNLQVGRFAQDAPDRATVIMNNAGFAPLHYQPRTQIDYMLQILSRAQYSEHARSDNFTFFNYLFEPGETEIFLPAINPVFRIHVIYVTGAPQEIPPDDKNRKMYSSNYRLTIFAL